MTLAAIHEAGIQVLLAGGHARLTTTRVAERAGVSVGSLYQYYPNKSALLAALLREHLEAVTHAVEQACEAAAGQPLAPMMDLLLDAFLAAKLHRADVSLALYAPMAEADGAALVRAANQRGAQAIGTMLASCPDLMIPTPREAASVLAVAVSGVMQAALEAGPGKLHRARLLEQLRCLSLGYLRALAEAG